MVQILPQNDIWEQLGGSFGTGINQGINQGLAERQASFLEAQKREKEIQGNLEKLSGNLGSFLRDTGRKDYGIAERDAIRNLANQMVQEGTPNYAALAQAVDVFENPENYGLSETLFGKESIKKFTGKGKASALTADEPRRFKNDIKKLFGVTEPSDEELRVREKAKTAKSLNDFSRRDLFLLRPQDISHLPEAEQEKFYEIAPGLAQQSQIAAESAAVPFVGRGLEERYRETLDIPGKASAMADISRIASELPFLSAALGGSSLLKQTLGGASLFGGGAAAEEAIRTLGTDKPADIGKIATETLIGAAFPWAEAGIAKLGGKLKSGVQALMRAEELTGAEAAGKLASDAVKEGISLERVAANDAKEISKLEKYLGKIEKVEKLTRKELKPSRVVEEFPKPRRSQAEEGKLFEKQIKLFDKLESEIAKDAAKMEKLAARTKLPSTIAKEANLKKVASSVIPEMESTYTRAAKNRARLADEAKTFKGTANEQERLNALLREAIDKEKEAGEALKKAIFQSETGKVRPTSTEISKQAEEAVEKLVKDAKDPSKKIEDLVKRYNPDRVKEAKKLLKKKKLPVDIYDDTYSKVMRGYLKEYEKKAKQLKTSLRDPKTILGMKPSSIRDMQRELAALERAIERDMANLVVHQREIGLREIARRKGIKEQVLKLKPKQIPESLKPTQEKLLSNIRQGEKLAAGVKSADSKGFEKLAEAAGVENKEITSLKKSLEDIKNVNKKDFKSYDDFRKYMNKNVKELLKPVKNQIAAGFILGSLDQIYSELTGKRIPSTVKTGVLGGIGIPRKKGVSYPFLALSAYLSNNLAKSFFIKQKAESLSKKTGREYLDEVNKMRKDKRFTQKEIKEILDKRQKLRSAS